MDKLNPKAPFEKLLDLKLVEAENGSARMELPFDKRFTNPHGTIHGGAITSLIDTAMAVAIKSKYPDKSFYTSRLDIKFRSPADARGIYAHARVEKVKGGFVFGRVEVEKEEGTTIAEASCIFFLNK